MQKGFTLIELMIVIAIIAIIAAIAIPNLSEARRSGNESAAIGSIRTISTAQAMYHEGDEDENGVLQYASELAQLAAPGVDLIDDMLGSGTKQGYVFDVNAPPAPDDQLRWSGTAEPAEPCLTGERYFYTDETGVIRFRNDGPAGPGDPELTRDGGSGDPGVSPCEPVPTPVAKRTEAELEALAAYHGDGEGSKETRFQVVKDIMATGGFMGMAFAGMDTDQNGKLSFTEVLHANPVMIAQELAPQLFPNASTEPIGNDTSLLQRLGSWLQYIQRFLKLGVANETEFPEVSIQELIGGGSQQPPGNLPPGSDLPPQQPPSDNLGN